MLHQSDLINTDIESYLAQHERKQLLKLLTCGSVDDGKSTLIGRLLYDSKMIYDDQLAAIKVDSANSVLDTFDLSLLVDGLQAEREQGITIDVAYRYFSTAKRKFIISDTPGHEQYTRNMVTGASTCDLSVILIDARYGIQTQTKRHSFISSLLGIKHIIVAVNKMDLKDFRADVFEAIKKEYLDFSNVLKPTTLLFIPISALHGDNVVNPSENMPWYAGETLMTALEEVEITATYNFQDMRFPVQYVNRPNLDFRGFCGTLASGAVSKGDSVVVLPSGKNSRIKSIITYGGELNEARTPMAVTLTLEDEIDISRGDMLVHSDNQPYVQEQFVAIVVWMVEQPLLPNKEYNIKHTSKDVRGCISELHCKIDVNTFQEQPVSSLQLNDIGRCSITLQQPICFDSYALNRATGSFIIIDRLTNATVGAGMIVNAAKGAQSSSHSTRASMRKAPFNHVTAKERADRYAQKPITVLFVGLSGAGKTTLAYALERQLFDMGKSSMVLDSQDLYFGLSKDLPHDQRGSIENLRRAACMARQMNDAGLVCCAAFVISDQVALTQVVDIIRQDDCFIVYLNTPYSVCKKRDPNGFYATEANDHNGYLLGASFLDEVKNNVDLILSTDQCSVESCVEQVLQVLVKYKIV